MALRRLTDRGTALQRALGCDMKTVTSDPDPKHVSTSYVERQNPSMRTSMRDFARLTNGSRKKVENQVVDYFDSK